MTDPETGVDLPRFQEGAHPQHLLATLLGEYTFLEPKHFPSAAIVRLLAEFGITSVAARNALSRVAKRGLLDKQRVGRQTYYRITDRAAASHHRRMRYFVTFGAEPPRWDGYWTVVAFSVSEQERPLRHTLRVQLRRLGLAPLYDGLWVSPHGRAEEVTEVAEELGLPMAVMTATFHGLRALGRDPAAAFGLDGLRRGYEEFIGGYEPLLERVRAGRVGVAEALVARTELMDHWRVFPDTDPDLPPEFLPPDWPLPRAHAIFLETHDALAPLAELRLRQILREFDPRLAEQIRYHRIDEA